MNQVVPARGTVTCGCGHVLMLPRKGGRSRLWCSEKCATIYGPLRRELLEAQAAAAKALRALKRNRTREAQSPRPVID